MLKRTVRIRLQLFADSIAKHLQTSCGLRLAQQQCADNFMEWVSMAKQLHPNLTSPSAMQSIGYSDVKHTTTQTL
ncbi:unnamed protein product, partial [Staurois parvus]